MAAQAPPTELSADDGERWRAEVRGCGARRRATGLVERAALYVAELAAAGPTTDEHAGHVPPRRVVTSWYATAAVVVRRRSDDHARGRSTSLGLDTLGARSTTSTPPAVCRLFGTADPDAVRRRLRDDRSLALRHGGGDRRRHDLAVMERAWTLAADWFRTMPSSRCDVLPVSGGPAAYYISPPRDLSGPGKVSVNVADPSQWTRFDLAADDVSRRHPAGTTSSWP